MANRFRSWSPRTGRPGRPVLHAAARGAATTLRDAFGFDYVDAGGGWLIFALPPAELGVHPAEGDDWASGVRHQLSFMCDNIDATVRDLRAKGVEVKGEVKEESYGITVMLSLPGGLEAMLYEPRHEMAIRLSAASPHGLVTILNEIVNGTSGEAAYLLNSGDRGLLASLDNLAAEAASATPGGGSSVAAHADHLRYGLSLMNRWARGEDPWGDANYSMSWTRQRVTEDEWRNLRDALAAEARALLDAVRQRRTWDDTAVTTVMGSTAHLAYHLGAIRQIARATAGPKATD